MKVKFLNFVLILMSLSLSAQSRQQRLGTQDYKQLAYDGAIQKLERSVKSGKLSKEEMPATYKMIADSYYNNSFYDIAQTWYHKIYTEHPEFKDRKYLVRYALTQKSINNYSDANSILNEASSILPEDTRVQKVLNNPNYLHQINERKTNFTLEPITFNSIYSDYGPAYYGDNVIFTSTRDTTVTFTKHVHTWTGKSFSNLFAYNDSIDKVKPFSKMINSAYNEATPVFTDDLQRMYFTRNNYTDKKKGYDENNRMNLKIYYSDFVNDKWTEARELPFNDDQYSCAHPALSPDGRWLYFTSDMKSVRGDSNIYRVQILAKNRFSMPQNLGSVINTEGRESFPFLDIDGNLYFASDGHPGLGGFDIFVANVTPSGEFLEPVNLGPVINSPMDDFALIMDKKQEEGYFSSNRYEGVGNDDIYKFKVHNLIKCEQEIAGVVRDEITQLPIAGATIDIFDRSNKLVTQLISDENGNYQYDVVCAENLRMKFKKDTYQDKELKVKVNNITGRTIQDAELVKTPLTEDQIAAIKITEKNDLNKLLKLEIIYFDLAKWNIRPDAVVELDKVAKLLIENPSIKIVIRSHTDSRDSFKNNQVLSENRAQSTRNWLINERGINPNRIQAKGFGEKHLLNECADGVKCSEEQHQLNRRSEFIILED